MNGRDCDPSNPASPRVPMELEQIRLIADHLPQLCWSCLPDGHCDYLSQRWVEYTGVLESEHHGSGWLNAIHPDDRARTQNAWDAFVRRDADYEVDYRLRRHDGEYRWFKTRGVLICDAAQVPVRVLGTTTDITDKKSVEDENRQNREQLEAALTASGAGTFLWTLSTNELSGDQGLDRLFGLASERSVKSLKSFLSVIHPEDRVPVKDALQRCRESLGDLTMEFRVVWPDKSVRWLAARGKTMLHKEASSNYVTGACIDITDRKNAEARIREMDERAAFVRKASGVGFWYCDLPFDVLEWDTTVKEHFHLPFDAWVTIDTFYDRIHPDDRAPTKASIESSISEHRSYDVHYRTVHPESGEQKWIRAIGRTFYAADGTPTRFDGVTLDVTQQRRVEKRQEFLATLSTDTQPLLDPEEISALTAKRLAGHLRVDRCAYAEVEDETNYVITGDYGPRIGSIVGRWPIAAFGEAHLRAMRLGEPYVVNDAHDDTRITAEHLAAYDATAIRAVICVPLLKGGRLTAAMAVHQSVARRWSADEVDLVRTVVAQCWESLERARAHRLLRASEEQLRVITNVTPALIAFVDAEKRYQFANEQYEAWFGLPRDQIVGKHLWEVVGEKAYQRLSPFVERVLAGERFDFEAFAPYPTGSRHIHAAFIPRFEGERVVGYFSLITDITARISAQEQLRASEERFRAFMDNSPAAAWITAADGEVRYVSAAYSRLFDLQGREIIGAKPEELYPEEFAKEYLQNIRTVALTGSSLETIERAPRPDGSIGDFLVYKFPLPGGELVGGVAIDITDRLRAEAQLLDADRRKDEFLATLAHELRNPLAPIRNGLKVLRLAPPDSDKFTLVHSMMERQVTHMVRLVEDLLDVSRITRNRLELRKQRVTLSEIVQSAVETCRPLLEQFEHQLSIALPAAPVVLWADLTRLAQVFSNLLNNSAKYTAPHGTISLTAHVVDNDVVIKVRDNGLGIPAAAIPNLFEMFSQVDSNMERAQGGLGIGLTLVRRLVELHGGTVSAHSDGPGKGSEFSVALPLLLDSQPSELAPVSEWALAPHGGRRILIVDDNRDAAMSLEMMLRAMGNETFLAYDGEAAVSAAESFRPELIILDIGLPKLNGYDACRQIRAQPWSSQMVIVALSGWGQEEDRRKSLEAGFDRHLVKPLEFSVLEELLAP